MPSLIARSTTSDSPVQQGYSSALIAVCVLSGIAGICAVAVCIRYIRSSESRSLRTAQNVKMMLDDELRKSASTVNDKPPPYSYRADLRPVSGIP